MTRDEAVVQVQVPLGFRSDKTSDIIVQLQRAQETLERGTLLPWFLNSERAFIDSTAGEERIPVPDDFLRELEESSLWYVPDDADADEVSLKKDDEDYLRELYGRNAPGLPVAYAIDALYFRLFPTPDAVYRFKLLWKQEDAVLTSDVENKWLKHAPNLLIGMAGKVMAVGLRDAAALNTFTTMETQALGELNRMHVAREVTNRRYQMGEGN